MFMGITFLGHSVKSKLTAAHNREKTNPEKKIILEI